jgi:ribosomal protein L37AE/L43A
MMGMSLSLSHHIAIPCPACKRTKCKSDCPLQRHLALSAQQKRIPCPKCSAHAVDINVDDFYECRECRTQYTTGSYDESWERTQLIVDMDALISEGVVAVLVYPTKGEGKIRIDQAMLEIEKELEALEAKRGRRRRN